MVEGIRRCVARICLGRRRKGFVTSLPLQVFEGVDSSNEESCVIKVLKPVAKKKIKREIKILRNLAGGPNVVRLMDIVHDPPSRSNSLVMEYVENTDWKDLFGTLTEMEIKFYLFQLLRVSAALHLAYSLPKFTANMWRCRTRPWTLCIREGSYTGT